MALQEREKNILAILTLVVVFVVFFYIFKPSNDKAESLKSQIHTLQTQLSKPLVNKKKVSEIKEVVDNLEKEISGLNQQIPETEKRGFLIKDIEDLAKENKIEILSFIPKEAVPVTITGKEIDTRLKRYRKRSQSLEEQHARVLKTVINIDAQGKFRNFSNFFADIITYYRAVEISDLIITRSGVASKGGEDKRFARRRKSKDPLEDAKNMDLSVSFTLLAYTSITQ